MSRGSGSSSSSSRGRAAAAAAAAGARVQEMLRRGAAAPLRRPTSC